MPSLVRDPDSESHGRVSTGLVFTHPDGRPYGEPPPTTIDDAVTAIRGTGYSAAEARSAVAAAASHVGASAPLEELIRAAFQQLHKDQRT